MTPTQFKYWMHIHGLSLTEAGLALGVSRRHIAYLASGRRSTDLSYAPMHDIPRAIELATVGYTYCAIQHVKDEQQSS